MKDETYKSRNVDKLIKHLIKYNNETGEISVETQSNHYYDILLDEDLYLEFVTSVVEPITTVNAMSRLRDEELMYDEVVMISDEVFGLLILEDRIRLWAEIGKRRVARDDEISIMRKLEDEDGNCIEDTLRDENDQAYTLYSNGGQHDPNVLRGFNSKAIERMNEYMKLVRQFRDSEDGKSMMQNVRQAYLGYRYDSDNHRRKRLRVDSGNKAEGGQCRTSLCIEW